MVHVYIGSPWLHNKLSQTVAALDSRYLLYHSFVGQESRCSWAMWLRIFLKAKIKVLAGAVGVSMLGRGRNFPGFLRRCW